MAQNQETEGQQEQYIDAVAVFAGELLKEQQRFNKLAGAENDPRIKGIYREMGGTVLACIVDLVKLLMETRDGTLAYVAEHDERIGALEDESEGAPVMDEEDKILFLRCYGEGKGAILMLKALGLFAQKPHNAAEYESQLKNVNIPLLDEVLARFETMVERITDLSTSDVEDEDEDEDESGEGTDPEADQPEPAAAQA